MRPNRDPIAVTPALLEIRERARRLHLAGRLREALAAHAEALDLAPEAVGIHVSAGMLAHELGMPAKSLAHFAEAARLDPRCFAAIDAARRICVAAGLTERAFHYAEAAQRLEPSRENLLACRLSIPAIARSRAAIRATRLGYERNVDELLASPPRLAAPDGVLGTAAFFLAYHGENDRALQIKTARMFARAIPELSWTAAHCRAAGRRPGKIRVGFISRFFYSHSIFATSCGLIEKLARERFEVHLLRITPAPADAATARLRAAADHALDLDADVYRAREQIASLELDILFFQDIGMETTSYFLAFARLARVQCVSFGHPNTTGIETLDYFVSNDLFEPEDGSAHYSETLWRLEDLPTLAYYERPAASAVDGAALAAMRAQLGLTPGSSLYLCPQTLYKLHPDMDSLFAGILRRDAAAVIVLIEGQFDDYTSALRARFAASLPEFAARIVFSPRLGFAQFLLLLAAADVILDTVHFNGMNSSLESFAMATPVVTLPGRLQRGRHTYAMYQKMGIDAGIARSPEHYVEIAVRIATDAVHRAGLREALRARSHVLFEDARVVEEFERFFVASLRQSAAV